MHNHHQFKIIPHPYLLASNKSKLAKRAMDVIARNSYVRDPLTGWTKTDAKTIIEEAERDQHTYHTRQDAIVAEMREQSKRNLQFLDRLHQIELDTIRDLTHSVSWRPDRYDRGYW